MLDAKTKTLSLTAGYYDTIDASTTLNPFGKIEYHHHIHSLSTNEDIIVNDTPAVNSVTSPYQDNYSTTTPGGCFTSGRYTSHTHTSSCKKHTHTGNSTDGGGCYTKAVTKKVTKEVECTNDECLRWDHSDDYYGDWYVFRCRESGHEYVGTQAGHKASVDTGKTKTTYEINCGKNVGDYECGGSPLNTNYKYFRSCGHTAGEITQAIITY